MSFNDLLKSYKATDKVGITHTRIPGGADSGIYGGKFIIPQENTKTFMDKYFEHVITNRNQEYLTERQLYENGPILIDLDLKYAPDIKKRQHNQRHITSIVELVASEVGDIYTIPDNTLIKVFVMEKPNVNALLQHTKDGIHIIMCLQSHKAIQVMLRRRVIEKLNTILGTLPIINTCDEIYDASVTKGDAPWQMYGSGKPYHEVYAVSYHIEVTYKSGLPMIEVVPINKFSIEDSFECLSARNTNNPIFKISASSEASFSTIKQELSHTRRIKVVSPTIGQNVKIGDYKKDDYIEDVTSEKYVDDKLVEYFNTLCKTEYFINEAHQYVMILSGDYYRSGSYNNWIKVGMALRNTSNMLFLTWVKMSCRPDGKNKLKDKEGKFDWVNGIAIMRNLWNGFAVSKSGGFTYRSIMYWAMHDNRDGFDAINRTSVMFYVDQSLQGETNEFDIAQVLYCLYKGKYVCISINKKIWYEYKNHRWRELDYGVTLRIAMSVEVHEIYMEKSLVLTTQLMLMAADDPVRDKLTAQIKKLAGVAVMLKRTQPKQNIMTEAMNIFFDEEFVSKIDKDPYLLGVNNGVIDFRTRTFRSGRPDDCITKTTGYDYLFGKSEPDSKMCEDITEFMSQLFPVEAIRTYMWNHLASCCIGVNTNQTFHIYKGSGRNGKSALTSLMSKCLGGYRGIMPLPLLTSKRSEIGGTSSELYQLNGVRYAVSNEPSKGDKFNDGIIKELTGGTDAITARDLYKPSISFIPSFKIVITTNVDIGSADGRDDGMWRRTRYIPFDAKFLVNPYEDPRFPVGEYPYQYPLDKYLEQKMVAWGPVMLYLLVKISFNKPDGMVGDVPDCSEVMDNNDKHRDKQDYFSSFIRECIKEVDDDRAIVKKNVLYTEFKRWYIANFGKNPPKGQEFYEFMTSKYGVYKLGWKRLEIISDD